MSNELLRKAEEKQDKSLAEDLSASSSFDEKKFGQVIALRREKLETIRPFIQLKTLHIIQEKINGEEQMLDKIVAGKKKENARKQEKTGVLPKTFFELRGMKPKSLRIN